MNASFPVHQRRIVAFCFGTWKAFYRFERLARDSLRDNIPAHGAFVWAVFKWATLTLAPILASTTPKDSDSHDRYRWETSRHYISSRLLVSQNVTGAARRQATFAVFDAWLVRWLFTLWRIQVQMKLSMFETTERLQAKKMLRWWAFWARARALAETENAYKRAAEFHAVRLQMFGFRSWRDRSRTLVFQHHSALQGMNGYVRRCLLQGFQQLDANRQHQIFLRETLTRGENMRDSLKRSQYFQFWLKRSRLRRASRGLIRSGRLKTAAIVFKGVKIAIHRSSRMREVVSRLKVQQVTSETFASWRLRYLGVLAAKHAAVLLQVCWRVYLARSKYQMMKAKDAAESIQIYSKILLHRWNRRTTDRLISLSMQEFAAQAYELFRRRQFLSRLLHGIKCKTLRERALYQEEKVRFTKALRKWKCHAETTKHSRRQILIAETAKYAWDVSIAIFNLGNHARRGAHRGASYALARHHFMRRIFNMLHEVGRTRKEKRFLVEMSARRSAAHRLFRALREHVSRKQLQRALRREPEPSIAPSLMKRDLQKWHRHTVGKIRQRRLINLGRCKARFQRWRMRVVHRKELKRIEVAVAKRREINQIGLLFAGWTRWTRNRVKLKHTSRRVRDLGDRFSRRLSFLAWWDVALGPGRVAIVEKVQLKRSKRKRMIRAWTCWHESLVCLRMHRFLSKRRGLHKLRSNALRRRGSRTSAQTAWTANSGRKLRAHLQFWHEFTVRRALTRGASRQAITHNIQKKQSQTLGYWAIVASELRHRRLCERTAIANKEFVNLTSALHKWLKFSSRSLEARRHELVLWCFTRWRRCNLRHQRFIEKQLTEFFTAKRTRNLVLSIARLRSHVHIRKARLAGNIQSSERKERLRLISFQAWRDVVHEIRSLRLGYVAWATRRKVDVMKVWARALNLRHAEQRVAYHIQQTNVQVVRTSFQAWVAFWEQVCRDGEDESNRVQRFRALRRWHSVAVSRSSLRRLAARCEEICHRRLSVKLIKIWFSLTSRRLAVAQIEAMQPILGVGRLFRRWVSQMHEIKVAWFRRPVLSRILHAWHTEVFASSFSDREVVARTSKVRTIVRWKTSVDSWSSSRRRKRRADSWFIFMSAKRYLQRWSCFSRSRIESNLRVQLATSKIGALRMKHAIRHWRAQQARNDSCQELAVNVIQVLSHWGGSV